MASRCFQPCPQKHNFSPPPEDSAANAEGCRRMGIKGRPSKEKVSKLMPERRARVENVRQIYVMLACRLDCSQACRILRGNDTTRACISGCLGAPQSKKKRTPASYAVVLVSRKFLKASGPERISLPTTSLLISSALSSEVRITFRMCEPIRLNRL